MKKPYISSEKIIVHSHGVEREKGEVIGEMPVSLTVNGTVWLTFMCTPVDLDALAIGFLYNEGLLKSKRDIADVRVCPGLDNVDVWLNISVKKPRKVFRTTGCTGGVTFLDAEQYLREQDSAISLNGWTLSTENVLSLVGELFNQQSLYKQTGGVHTSALFSEDGLVFVAEDVGRHNTLDKLAGKCVLNEVKAHRLVLLTTGRISSEMLQKAHRMGVKVVISRTSPTSLSLELAQKAGITLIGYARRDRFTIYTHAQRIALNCENSMEHKTPA